MVDHHGVVCFLRDTKPAEGDKKVDFRVKMSPCAGLVYPLGDKARPG